MRLRLTGRWLEPGDPEDHDALLVVTLHGHRHRFAADRGRDTERGHSEVTPTTTTLMPTLARAGDAWSASFTIPGWAEPGHDGQAWLWVGLAAVPVPAASTAPAVVSAPSTGFAEPSTGFAEPSTGFAEPSTEFAERLAQVQSEAAAARVQLAAASVSREAASSEAAGLRAELERLGTELGVTRERLAAESGDLGEAERLLGDARTLSEQLRAWR